MAGVPVARTPAGLRGFGPRSKGVEQPEEDGKLGPPGQESPDASPAWADDLDGDVDDGQPEGSEVHAQPGVAFGLMFVAPSGRDRQRECHPSLQ